jgi:septal ring factor EnvC (AmiA/AmiB activator)
MTDAATKDDLTRFETHIDGRFQDFETRVEKRFDELMATMSQFAQDVDVRFSRVEHDISQVKQQVVDLQASHDRLMNTIDAFVSRIDGYETEMAVRDRQMERLLAWARKVSEKTGIPLENL